MATSSKDNRLATGGVRSTGNIRVAVPVVKAREATKDAADSLDRYGVKTELEGSIVVEVRKGWTTHGELLHVTFIGVEDGTEVRVATEQVMFTVRFDFGQARRDVQRLLIAIERFAKGDQEPVAP